MDQQALVEYRHRAVREVFGGSPVGEVAARYGTSRQSLHTWRRRFEQEGMPGLADRSRRPLSTPYHAAMAALTYQQGKRSRSTDEYNETATSPSPATSAKSGSA